MAPAAPHPDTLLSAAQREREYSPSSCIGGDYRPFIAAYAQQSRTAHAQAEQAGARWLDVAYGGLSAQRLLLCLPPPPPPPPPPALPALPATAAGVLVFIHGGYWQELSASESLFAAADCVRQGLAFCAVDYTLAPQASVGGIVAECRQALETLATRAAEWGIDRERIVVAGSSAGAHLAAMACLPAWRQGSVFRPHAALLLSGIFELEPLVGTSINQALGLDANQAHAQSPARHPLSGFPRTLLAWGENETAAFKRQSRRFARQLRDAGTACADREINGRNHFDVALDLGALSLGLFDAG